MRARIDYRDVCREILIRLARHESGRFSLSYFYDEDIAFVSDVATHLGWGKVKASTVLRRLRGAVRFLEQSGYLHGRNKGCDKQYLGEPSYVKVWEFTDAGYAFRLAPELWPHYKPQYTVEFELNWILDRTFPATDS